MFLILLFIASLYASSGSAHAAGESIDHVSLISTRPYGTKAKKTGFGSIMKMYLFGDIYKATSLDIEKDVKTQFKENTELGKYFTDSNEVDAIAKRIGDQANNEILSGKMNSTKAISAVRFVTEEIAKEVIRKILAKEGAIPAERSIVWEEKILAPFRECTVKAYTYEDANECKESLKADLSRNTGLALVYEITRSKVGPEFTAAAVTAYAGCLQKSTEKEPPIQNCAISSVKTQAMSKARAEVRRHSMKALAPARAAIVWPKVSGEFKKCLDASTEDSAIQQCTDQLTISTAAEIAYLKAYDNPAIEALLEGNSSKMILAAQVKKDFTSCMKSNLEHSVRDKTSGVLETANCENRVTNSVTRKVVLTSFNKSAEKYVQDPVARKKVTLSAQTALMSCWADDQSSDLNSDCLKGTVTDLAKNLAGETLNAHLPGITSDKKAAYLASLEKCLAEKLPVNMIQSEEASVAGIDFCGSALVRTASLTVAEESVRTAAADRLSLAEVDSLVAKHVNGNFKTCIGLNPDDGLLGKCARELKSGIGIDLATLLIPKELDTHLVKSAKPGSVVVDAQKKKYFVDNLLSKHKACINAAAEKTSAVSDMAGIYDCFKRSVGLTAYFVGRHSFRAAAGKYLEKEPELMSKLGDEFEAELQVCIEKKNGPAHPMNEFLDNVTSCAGILEKKYTVHLGQALLSKGVEENVKSGRPETESLKKALIAKHGAAFSACIENGSALDADQCAADLRFNSTFDIAVTAGRLQAKEILSTDKLPKQVQAVEAEFTKCVKSDIIDQCVRHFAKNLAKTLGSLKLAQALVSTLGSKDVKAEKVRIKALESSYHFCIDKVELEKSTDQAFHDNIRKCSDAMQEQTITLLQEKMHSWMATEKDDKEAIEVKNRVVEIVPCLDRLLPTAPFDEKSMSNINSQGLLEALAKTMADYINYDAKKAGDDLDAVFNQVMSDLEAAGPQEARHSLIKMLVERGMIDQFLKSIVRTQIVDSFQSLPKSERLPKQTQDRLLRPKNFDKIFSGKVMADLRKAILDGILEPVVVQGKSVKSIPVLAAHAQLKKRIAEVLLKSPHFGQAIISHQVQSQLNDLDGFSRFFASMLYGNQSLNWNKLRQSKRGQVAEVYIRDNILKPKMLGQKLTEKEQIKHMEKAKDLIKEAMQSS